MTRMDEVYKQVVKLRDEEGLNWTSIGNRLGIDRRTARKYYNSVAIEASPNAIRLLNLEPEVDRFRFTPVWTSGDMLVTCDWHVPLYDPEMINNLLKRAHTENIKKLIIGGDFFNGDSVSRYDDKQATKEAGYKTERKHSLEIFDVLLDTFEEIEFFEGNHDYRFVRLFNRKLNLEEIVKDVLLAGLSETKLERLNVSVLDHMYLDQDKLWRFSHQKDFSTVPLAVGRKFAAKYQCSIINAHSHHCAMGVAADGQNLIIEGGGLYDKEITEYVQKSSGHHEWVQGYTMFKGGIPTLFSPAFGNM